MKDATKHQITYTDIAPAIISSSDFVAQQAAHVAVTTNWSRGKREYFSSVWKNSKVKC